MKIGTFLLLALFLVTAERQVRGASAEDAAAIAQSLTQSAERVRNLLVEEKIKNAFDWSRRLSEHGVTWQPSLLAPCDLVNKLDDEQLRLYAGMKLFDAVYAAAFLQQKAVSDAAETLRLIQERLNLRSYADISANAMNTLNRAAQEPESVDLDAFFSQLARDYTEDIPELMAHPESAEFLADALFGFTLQRAYMIFHFYRLYEAQNDGRLDAGGRQQHDRGEWMKTMLELVNITQPLDHTTTVGGEVISKIGYVAPWLPAYQADSTPQPNFVPEFDTIEKETNRIRALILTPI